ncbi:MAG: AAA family ATPase [Sulfurovum sp.]|uniref:Lon protease family protein n=1 Tax=Sulfurovum sp. TaxID=1969726 RepID=UPI00286816D8|nr:ATP-binding protein [Sulfurovum sp.]MCO4845502.1 AAA family ATPase [Sulfurovum sp.]
MKKTLSVDKLYNYCNLEIFDFETTDELEELDEVIGQTRALKAISFGIGIKKEGYNLYAMGKLGSGKHSVVEKFIKSRAKDEVQPGDWCYVNNFEDPRKPIYLKVASSMGMQLKKDMEELIEELQSIIPSVFESEEYRVQKQVIIDKLTEEKEKFLIGLKERARKEYIAVDYTTSGYTLSPMSHEGKVLGKEEYQALNVKDKEQIQETIIKFKNELENMVQDIIIQSKIQQKEIRKLERNMTKKAVDNSIGELKKRYQAYKKIIEYLENVEEDIIDNSQDFLISAQNNLTSMGMNYAKQSGIFSRYRVNVLVSYKNEDSAPIIYENNPTYVNLFGEIENIAQMGTLLTDFNLIKAGALHRANGGYLILDASKVIMQPFVWEGLKRMLRSGEIRIESLAHSLSLMSTLTLEPEPIELDVKIVLIGSRILYYLLYNYDPEFKDIFKINADFEDDTQRNDENSLLYAKMIGMISKDNGIIPLNKEAVGKVIEYSSRMAEDSQKLSTNLGSLSDLLQEADFIAREKNMQQITKAEINDAIKEKIERSDRIKDNMYEAIDRGTILIETDGSAIGQINGVAVLDLGNFSFGHPSKITALTRLGKGGVINIEREVKLSGPTHNKGIMILSAYLGATYAKDFPLSITATLVFEQSYGKIDGDSASCAELFTLLSSLSEVALDQSIAVTGSVNQNGQVQAVGGINEKIEGFFDICTLVNSEKRNGIIIPVSNVKHLMLKEEVLEAVKSGKFKIYAIERVDEGMEILTGKVSGRKDENGKFPKGSINYLVEEKLKQLANKSKRKKI